VLIIVNPVAGWSWSTRRRLARVTAALERRGCTVTQRRTGPGAGDAERLAREAEAGFDVVVAAGGDGTLGAVANGLTSRALERACPLALLPFGTANVLAHEIGLPRGCGALAELIANGPERPVWPGCAGSRIFMTTASSGFDAETVAAVSPRLKRWLGRSAFAWAILLCLAAVPRRRTRCPRRWGRASRGRSDCRAKPLLCRSVCRRAAGGPGREAARPCAVS
jgi:diacylglycerol kinase family enzyme